MYNYPIINNAVLVTLSEEDAKLFVQFQKHYAFIKMLEDIKAFNLRDGNIKIHFNHLGEVKTIDKFEVHRLP